jgi:hypothetical protein
VQEKPPSIRRQWWKYAIRCVIKDNKFRLGQWNEFKVTSWRKREYGRHLIRISSKCLTPDFVIDEKKLSKEDELLFRNIIEANELDDLQNWLGIMIKRKIEKEIKAEQNKLAKEKESGFLGFFSKKPKKAE